METKSIKTQSRDALIDVTELVQQVVSESGVNCGICLVYCPHTTAGITINENADPAVTSDLLAIFNRLVPWEANYKHAEGNSAAHAKSSVVGASAQVIIEQGQLVLGTWQSIFFCEFDGPRTRKLLVEILPTHQ